MFYKILGPDRMPIHGGSGPWPEPGQWTAPQQVIPCRSGYHLCRVQNISIWIKHPMELWEAEGSGEAVTADAKVVYEQARLIRKLPPVTDRLLRLFVADCAERVLHLFERQCPDDGRPRAAIQAARDYAEGKIGVDELRAAAWAAWDAFSSIDSYGLMSIARKGVTWEAVAWEAAGAAAGAAAWAATRGDTAAGTADTAAVTTCGDSPWDASRAAEAAVTASIRNVQLVDDAPADRKAKTVAARQQERLWQGKLFLKMLRSKTV